MHGEKAHLHHRRNWSTTLHLFSSLKSSFGVKGLLHTQILYLLSGGACSATSPSQLAARDHHCSADWAKQIFSFTDLDVEVVLEQKHKPYQANLSLPEFC